MEGAPEYKLIPISELELDPENPRLPRSMKNKNEGDIIDFMLLEHSLIELMLAIGQNGYFPGEQLLVVKCGDKYKVIEGNRRLASVKLLNNSELATRNKIKINQVLEETTERPTEIPCIIFSNVKDIHKYLGFRHITGTKEWRMLEKARYLYDLRNNEFRQLGLTESSKHIAKTIGSKSNYVQRVVVGFEVYKLIEDGNFFDIKDLNDTSFYFNYIADSLNKDNIKNFLKVDFDAENPTARIDENNLKLWTEWLFKKNDQHKTRLIGDSKHLSMLNAVLGKEEAKKAFQEGLDLYKAFELTEELDTIFIDSIKNSINYLEQADSVVHKISHFYADLEDDLKTIRSLTVKIKSTKNSIDEREF